MIDSLHSPREMRLADDIVVPKIAHPQKKTGDVGAPDMPSPIHKRFKRSSPFSNTCRNLIMGDADKLESEGFVMITTQR